MDRFYRDITNDRGGRRRGNDRRGSENGAADENSRRNGDRRNGEDRRKEVNPRVPVKWGGLLERRASLWRFHHFAWRMRRQGFRRCSLLYPPLYRGF